MSQEPTLSMSLLLYNKSLYDRNNASGKNKQAAPIGQSGFYENTEATSGKTGPAGIETKP